MFAKTSLAIAAVLSPNDVKSFRPSVCSTLSMALAIGVPSAALMCMLPFSAPPACPARNQVIVLHLE